MTKSLVKGITKVLGITLTGWIIYSYGRLDAKCEMAYGVSCLDWINCNLNKLEEDEKRSKRISYK